MANIFNDDFREFIDALNKHEVEYLLVGGYAVILNGYRRSTGDMDIWVNVTAENHKRLLKAFVAFGLPDSDITEDNFLKNDAMEVFSYGKSPVSINIMKNVKGLEFDAAFKVSRIYEEGGLKIRFIHLNTLIEAKKASGRHKDIDDIEKLSNNS